MDVLAGAAPARDATYAEVGSRRPRPAGGARAALAAALEGRPDPRPLADLPLVESGTFFLSSGRMVRTPRWKYAHYLEDAPELYDLEADPWELENLAGRSAYRQREAALRDRLLELSIAAADPR